MSTQVRNEEPDVFLMVSDAERDLSSMCDSIACGYFSIESTQRDGFVEGSKLKSVFERKGPIDEPHPICSSVGHSFCLYSGACLADPAAHTDVLFPSLAGMVKGFQRTCPQETTYSWGDSFKDTPP